jgi:hypothetical protein
MEGVLFWVFKSLEGVVVKEGTTFNTKVIDDTTCDADLVSDLQVIPCRY